MEIFWKAGSLLGKLSVWTGAFVMHIRGTLLYWSSPLQGFVEPAGLSKFAQCSLMYRCLSVWVCESYVVHHLVGTGLYCAPPTCVVHHRAALCTMVHKGDLCSWEETLYREVAPPIWCTSTDVCKSIAILWLTTNMQINVHNIVLYRHTLWYM